MLRVGDIVKWMSPLDHDYLYGKIVSINRGMATVKGIGLYKSITEEVHIKYIRKLTGGKGDGICKRNNKLLTTKRKLQK